VSPSVPAESVSAPLTGTSSPPATSVAAKSAASPTPSPRGLPATAPPAPIVPAAAPSEGKDSRISGSAEASGSTSPQAAARSAPEGANARSAVSLDGPSDAKVGDEFQVVVQLSTQQAITRLRSQLRFDATALQLISATVGDVVPAAAGGPAVDAKGGGAQLDVLASPEDPVQGTGSLMIVRFKALAPRRSTNIAAMLNVLGGTGSAIGSSSAQPLKLAIEP